MNIVIVGAGFTGLSAAYKLLKKGHSVRIYERDNLPGGLAIGYKEKKWDWSLEQHYHHWFTSDRHILRLAEEVGYPVEVKRPKTSVFVDGKLQQLDSPIHVLTFPGLSVFDKLRMGFTLALLKLNPFWKLFENLKTTDFLPLLMGNNSYKKIWEPQMLNKFGKFANEIVLTWFWSRIKNRTPDLAYPTGGFLEFAEYMVKKIEELGGEVTFNAEVIEIKSDKNVRVKIKKNDKISQHSFDKSIITLPSFLFLKIAPDLPGWYKSQLEKFRGIGATNLVLRLKKGFFNDKTYWLSICDAKSPIMAIVEHTNFMDKSHYNNEHIVYLGKYLSPSDPYYSYSAEELLSLYDPFLKKINSSYKSSIVGYKVFKAPFAQSIVSLQYSKKIPTFSTPLKNVYLANIQQVYPWDRGTNYAVELGEKVVDILLKE